MTVTYKKIDTKTLPRPPKIDENGPGFQALLKKHKISASEYQTLRSVMGGAPTLAELGVFSAMWSEHCSYKSSRVHLKRFPTTGPNVVVGPGENAGVVRLSEKLCLAFKMESHNHPSYIEPYQGAATGVGGILRDVFCMGSRPIANLNCLRFGVRSHERTRYLQDNVVKGIGDYGNCMGIPTVGGNISFDKSYDGNCLVNAMTVGVIHEDRIFKGYATGTGNLVVYAGSATGRDGIHGASMASDSFSKADQSERSTVQVGDPFMEKLLLEATLEVLEKGLVIGLQDMGAAGLTSSSFEMAGRAGNGLFMDLDKVPVRTDGMTAYELMLSESQERMLMVIKPENWPALKAVLDKWQLAGDVIGHVTDTGRVQVHHQGKLELDVPVGPMTDNAPKYERPMQPRARGLSGWAFTEKVADAVRSHGAEDMLAAMLHDTGEKLPVYTQYDHHIGNRTVHGPHGQGAAVLWVRSEWADPNEPHLGALISTACNESYCRVNPRMGGAHAVLKSARMIAAAGGEPLAVTDCLNYGNPEDPEVMWEFSEGVDGISDACRELGIPVVSGNVSLYNQTDGVSIAPTPMIGMVGKMKDVRHSPPATIRTATELFLLYPKAASLTFGGSLAAKLVDLAGRDGEVPAIDWQAERESMTWLRDTVARGFIAAARDVGQGGVSLAAAKMVVATGHGVELDLSKADLGSENAIIKYFGELSGAYLIAAEAPAILRLGETLRYNALVPVGRSTDDGTVSFGGWSLTQDKARAAFRSSWK